MVGAELVGLTVGNFVGSGVGLLVGGNEVGCCDGRTVGFRVGFCDGEIVGFDDGP